MGKVNHGYPAAILLGTVTSRANLTASGAIMQPKMLLIASVLTVELTASDAGLGKSTTGIPTLTYMTTFESKVSLNTQGQIVQPLRTAGAVVSLSTTDSSLMRRRRTVTTASTVSFSAYPANLSSSRYALPTGSVVTLTASSAHLWKLVYRKAGHSGPHAAPTLTLDQPYVTRQSVLVASDTTNRPRKGGVKDVSDA